MTPTGTVTFLFTDIEGSTKLAQEFPDKLAGALEKHNKILRETVQSYNGIVFDVTGDAFCCAFGNAEDAIKAAVIIQLNLKNENWDEAVIKIRIGIHTGNAEWSGNNYMGYLTLARSARVMSAAYGEQILISKDAYEFFLQHKTDSGGSKVQIRTLQDADSLNKNELVVDFRDLGERRLKDVIQPVRLFQITYPGLREEFPPLKTLDARPNNLPVQLTSFIGREKEMKQIKDIMKQNRLLTLLGSGGSGKTRLAMQTGADLIDDFPNGVFINELAPLKEKSMIIQTLMDSIGIKEEPGFSPVEKLTDHLKDLEILLIFDNCEHLINECAVLAESLLRNCSKLKIIATSRESLNCSGEHSYRVPSLALPEGSDYNTPEKLIKYEAVRLFLERALSVNSSFRLNNNNAPAIAEICSRLDGIPLAIELAAARSNILTADKINDRLNDRFKLLSGGKRTALPRQKTLKALIDWSYDLLSQKEKILWHRVSVFSGGWTLEAAEEIINDENISKEEIVDLLEQLANKSIIIFNSDKNRYNILETIKHYGNEKLKESNEENDLKVKYLKYYIELSIEAEPKLIESEMHIWLEKLESEHGNFQSAIAWAIGEGKNEEAAILAGTFGSFWEIRGYYSIGIKLLESIIVNSHDISKTASAKVLMSIGILARNLGDFELSQKSLQESLEIYKGVENKSAIVSSLNNLGITATDLGNYEHAKKFHEESLMIARENGDKSGIANSLISIGTVYYHQGNYHKAQEYFRDSLELKREIGNKQGIAMCLNNLGSLESRQQNFVQSKILFEESLKLSREIGDKTGIGMCLNNLAKFAFEKGNSEQAKSLYEESLHIWRELGDKLGIILSINNLGFLELNNENTEKAKKLFDESLVLCRVIGYKIGLIETLIGFSGILSSGNQLSLSIKLLGAADSALKTNGVFLIENIIRFKEQIISDLQVIVSKEEYEKYREEGKKLTLEEACQLIVNS